MVDEPDGYHVLPSTPHSLSVAQRAFVEAAEAVGATAPVGARLLTELPRLSGRELDELVELGLVREAADWRYYVFRSRRGIAALPPMPPRRPWTRSRYLKTFIFWLILILIPFLLLRLNAPR